MARRHAAGMAVLSKALRSDSSIHWGHPDDYWLKVGRRHQEKLELRVTKAAHGLRQRLGRIGPTCWVDDEELTFEEVKAFGPTPRQVMTNYLRIFREKIQGRTLIVWRITPLIETDGHVWKVYSRFVVV